ncbi:MAG: hypothetical protein ACRDD7_12890 [Peptostreptococcaceae bacterium]
MKKILALILVGALSFGVIGCGADKKPETENKENTSTESKKEEVKLSKIDKFKNYLKDKGFKVEDNEVLAFDMMKANDGAKFKVDGQLIEIYTYDKDKLIDGAQEMLDAAVNGSVNMSGFNIPVVYNNYAMLGRVNEHSKKDEIINIFKSL